jgi:glutamyl-tRNA reductase
VIQTVNLLLWSFHIRNVGVDGLKDITKSAEEMPLFIKQLLRDLNAKECFYLATCNRVEFLILADEAISPKIKLQFTNLKPKTFNRLDQIATHLLEVACSMDSVVFGENQILGQIKAAFTEQQKQKLVGAGLSKILNLVLREAKKIRTETQLSRLQTSISSVAGKLIHQTLKNKASVLLVGYGETHKLLHKYLEKKSFKDITVTNRTSAKLNSKELSCKTLSWNDFSDASLENYDVISFATSSEHTLLTKEMMTAAKPQMVVDLCIPPNADSKIAKAAKAQYLGLDQIQKILSKDKREAALLKKQLQKHISQSVLNLLSDLSIQSIHTIITGNIEKSLKIHEESLAHGFENVFGSLTFEQKVGLAQWSEKLIKKINHVHLKTYKEVVNAVQTQSRNTQK